jgi:hypothetical protein
MTADGSRPEANCSTVNAPIPLSARFKFSLGFSLVSMALYQLVNRFPLREPQLIEQNAIDLMVPRLEWTVWPYGLLLLTVIVVPLLLSDRWMFARVMWASVFSQTLNLMVWIGYPTMVLRAAAPEGSGLTDRVFRLLFVLDAPNNCFPSAHVAIPAIMAVALARAYPRWQGIIGPVFVLWSFTILTTEQHYAVDWVGGVVSAAIGWWIAKALVVPNRRVVEEPFGSS